MSSILAEHFDSITIALEGEQISEWPVLPFQLVSLFDMYRLKGEVLLTISRTLEGITHLASNNTRANSVLPVSEVQMLQQMLSGTLGSCKAAKLDLSAMYAQEMLTRIGRGGCTYSELGRMLPIFQDRLRDEITATLLMFIPRDKAEYYEKKNLFGDEVNNNFPSATLDIEEAGKCYAAGRNTATVMHLMRVMEVGLRTTATALGLPDPTNANWQSIIDKVNKEINQKTAAKDPDWIKVEPFYSQVSAHLFAVKTAWRNPVMHVHSTYDEERALDIFNAVKGFMRHLATELKE